MQHHATVFLGVARCRIVLYLGRMATTPDANAPTLTITEAAELMNVHRSTVHRWIERGLILRHRTATGQVYVLRAELERLSVPVPDDAAE
jgi:excisionase family DNA binding protein